MCGIINRLVTWKLFGPEGGTRQLHHKDIKMIEHLRKYIGLYLTAMCLPFAFGYILSDDHPVWVWWLILILVVWKTPPYSLSDRFWGGYMRLLDWALKPLINWIKTWPTWARIIFALIVLIGTEEFILSPIGYTMYPWRMDFGL